MRRNLPYFIALSLGLAGLLPLTRGREQAATGAVTTVWPAPPAEARVMLDRCVTSPEDFGIKPGFIDRMANLLTGSKRGHEKFIKPFSVAVDERGNICLTDTGANSVWFLDLQHRRASHWENLEGSALVSPVAVAKQQETIYLADSGLGQVIAFDESGHVRFRIKDPLVRPAGLTVQPDRLYVADSAQHRIFVFDLQGHPVGSFGERGVGPGQFNFPTHLSSDAAGHLYVVDSLNSRVQVLTVAGQPVGLAGSTGDGSGHFSRPKGVAADEFGHLFVTDALFDNIQIFDRDGQFLLDVGSSGSKPGEFWMPVGIAISRDRKIYIADSYNARIQVLRYLHQP
jgi:DNA-binding beta-propeller fold protein YncE